MRRGFDGSTLSGMMTFGRDGPSLVRNSLNRTRLPRLTRVATSPVTNSRNPFGTWLGISSPGETTGVNGCSIETPLASGNRNLFGVLGYLDTVMW